MLVVDAFEDELHVPKLASAEFYDGAFLALAEPGAMVVNFMNDDPKFDLTLQRLERAFGGAVLVHAGALRPEHPRVCVQGHCAENRVGARCANARKRLESQLGLPFTRYVSRLRAMNRWTRGGAYNFAMKFWSDSFADGARDPARTTRSARPIPRAA